MRRWVAVVFLAGLIPWAVAQTASPVSPAPGASTVRITGGPVIDYADDSLAVVSWTTNLPSTSTVHFGTDPQHLDHIAAGATAQTRHRVNIADLSPSTKYYFVVESADATNGGVPARSVTESLETVAAGQPAIERKQPGTENASNTSITTTNPAEGTQNTASATSSPASTATSNPAPSSPTTAATPVPQPVPATKTASQPGEPTRPAQQDVPAGTQIQATLDQALSTKSSQVGDSFSVTVTQPVRGSGGTVLIPAGSKINGHITESEQGKTLPAIRGRGRLNVRFIDITFPQHVSAPLVATLVSVHPKDGNGKSTSEGEITSGTSAKNTAKDVGIGAGAGTLAGLIFGSALKGLAIGAIAGGGYVLATDGKDVELPAQTEITVRLDQNLIVPASVVQSQSATAALPEPSSASSKTH